MTAAGLPSSEPGGAPLSIGSVLDALRADFPEITISKIRFLESEGLIRPARTSSGYRQFSDADVLRLRFVLSAQRDHYLPLKVIRAKLDEFDRAPSAGGPVLDAPSDAGPLAAGRAPVTGGPSGPSGPPGPPGVPGPRGVDDPAVSARMRSLSSVADRVEPDEDPDGPRPGGGGATLGRETLLAEDGVDAALLDALDHHGILRADLDGRYEPEDVVIARTAAALARLGVEPRLLRSARASADRDVGLLTQLVTPVARARGPEATQRADELSAELAALSGRLHALLVGVGLRQAQRR